VIKEDDVKNGLKAYSTDLLRDINLEIRDVEPTAADAPYAFIGAPPLFGEDDLREMLRDGGVRDAQVDSVLEMLLWFAFEWSLLIENRSTSTPSATTSSFSLRPSQG